VQRGRGVEEGQKKFTDRAHLQVRRFPNLVAQFCWPMHEVVVFLRSGARLLSMHFDDGILEVPTVVRREIFPALDPAIAVPLGRDAASQRPHVARRRRDGAPRGPDAQGAEPALAGAFLVWPLPVHGPLHGPGYPRGTCLELAFWDRRWPVGWPVERLEVTDFLARKTRNRAEFP
jgi:hypothetical protein